MVRESRRAKLPRKGNQLLTPVFLAILQARKFFGELNSLRADDDLVNVLFVFMFDLLGKDVRVDEGGVENPNVGKRPVPSRAVENMVCPVNNDDRLRRGDFVQG